MDASNDLEQARELLRLAARVLRLEAVGHRNRNETTNAESVEDLIQQIEQFVQNDQTSE